MRQPKKNLQFEHISGCVLCNVIYAAVLYDYAAKVLKYLLLMCILALISVSDLSLRIFFLLVDVQETTDGVCVVLLCYRGLSCIFVLDPFTPPLVRGWLMSGSPPQ